MYSYIYAIHEEKGYFCLVYFWNLQLLVQAWAQNKNLVHFLKLEGKKGGREKKRNGENMSKF